MTDQSPVVNGSRSLRINIELLEERKIGERQDRDVDVNRQEAEIRERWMRLMTPEYIREKIAEACANGQHQVFLVDENMIDGVDYRAIGLEVSDYVQSMLEGRYDALYTWPSQMTRGIVVVWRPCFPNSGVWPDMIIMVVLGTTLIMVLLWRMGVFSSHTNDIKR